MYAPQPNIPSATKYFLDALNTGEAQLKTADGADTVFAQKMQQGIAQGVPQTQGMQGAKQDYAAAAPSVAQNMKQAEVQRMMQQAMQPKPAGIEQLPAQNMQGMQKMAGGGVVGYNGENESEVKQQVTEILQKAPAARSPQENAILRAAGVNLEQRTPGEGSSVMALDKYLSSPFIREVITGGAHKLSDEELRKRSDAGGITESIFRALGGNRATAEAPPQAMRPEDAFASPRMDQPQRIATPSAPPMSPDAQTMTRMQGPRMQAAQSGPSPQAQQAQRPSGIAQLTAPTAEEAMASARSGLGLGGTEDLRAIAEEGRRLRAARPPAGVQTLDALRKEREMSQQQYEAANKAAERGGIMAFLQGMASGSLGGGGKGYEGFAQSEAGRKKAFAAEETLRASKMDAINDANEAAKIGDHDKYMEARTKIADIDRQIAQIESTYAGNILQSRANVYGTDVSARERAADRAAQAALRNLPTMEQQMADRVMKDWLAKNPGKTLADAWDFYRGAGKGLEQRAESAAEANRLKRQKLISDDPSYKMARFDLYQSTDPAKKADAQRRIKEIERDAGIVDESAAQAPTQPPPGVKVTRVGP